MRIESSNLLRLTEAQIRPASTMLSRAFQDDPLFGAYFPDASERERRLPNCMEFIVRDGIRFGEVHATSPGLEGVAVWFPSDSGQITKWWRVFRNAGRGISYGFIIGWKAVRRQIPIYKHSSSMYQRLAPERHWCLSIVGVDPVCQGKGHGGGLLRPMFARIDREGLPCYLETENEKNLPMYQRYGFRVLEESQIPGTETASWAMLREKPPR
jgi:ribosomal protein S18 acetylase RimI-like enzyme